MNAGASASTSTPPGEAAGAAAAPARQAQAGARSARPIDAGALERHARRVANGPAPWLHDEVARRMAARMAVLKQPPRRVLDWGAATAGANEALAAALKAARAQAHITPVRAFVGGDGARGGEGARAPGVPAPWWSPRRWRRLAAPVRLAEDSALEPGSADMLWANMVLHHLSDPEAVFTRWRQLLAVDGLLMFSTLGPGTLASLRKLYAQQRWPSPHAAFVDMHDLGDMLVHAGFADPVMDQEVLTLTWATPAQALAELRQLGGNAERARFAGLRTPRWRAALERALADSAGGSRIALEFEVVYGHAVRPLPRAKVAAETEVAVADMRQMLRARRTQG